MGRAEGRPLTHTLPGRQTISISHFLATFDNREIAVAFWLSAALFASLLSVRVSSAIAGVMRAFFVRPIMVSVFTLAGYVAILTYILAFIGIWAPSQLKLTILWFATVGVVGLFSAPDIARTPDLFARSVRESLKITLLLEFFINMFRMPLFAELAFVPIAVMIGALIAVTETKEEFISANKLLNRVGVLVGSLLLVYAAWKTATDFESVATVDTFRSFILPFLYSLLFLPFLWLAAVFIAYQEVFVRLQFLVKDESLVSYTKKSLIFRFRGKIKYLRTWFKAAWINKIQVRSDVEDSIQAVLRGESAV